MMLLVCCVFALLSSSIKATDLISSDDSTEVTKATCDQNETVCSNSCCPHPNAVCCNETQTCCREGNICLGSIPYCLGLKQDGESPSLFSERSTALRGTDCPSSMTPCYDKCCPLPDAVCCSDETTCCPAGTTCGPVGSKTCKHGLPGLKQDVKSPSLYSAKSTLLRGTDCPAPMTTCYGKCCFFPDAVCCSDETTCCPAGTTCGPAGSGTCNSGFPGLKQDGESPSLYPERSTVLRGTDCPSSMTPCYDKCCPLPNAVCCADETTCCPAGTTCGPVGSGTCKTGVDAVVHFLKAVLSKSMEIPSTNTFNYALPQSRPFLPKAGDNCCEAWFGYICCQFPSVCTTMGCM